LPERVTLLKVLGASISAYDVSLVFQYPGTFEAHVAVEFWMTSRWMEPWPRTVTVGGALALALEKKNTKEKQIRELDFYRE
jgi:hypothetical protein